MGLELFFWLIICFPFHIAFLASTFYQVFIQLSFSSPKLVILFQYDWTVREDSLSDLFLASMNLKMFISFFFGLKVLMLSDLEADFINPYDASSRINYFIVPEFIGQGLLCAFCLLTGHWIMFLMTVPVTCYHMML